MPKLGSDNELSNYLIKSYGYLRFKRQTNNFFILRKLPVSTSNHLLKCIPEYALACCHETSFHEIFNIVFTNKFGVREYASCLYTVEGHLIVLTSHQRLFEFLEVLLREIFAHKLYEDSSWNTLCSFIDKFLYTSIDRTSIKTIKCAREDPRHPSFRVRVPCDLWRHYHQHIFVYYSLFSLQIWIDIHLSVLLERSLLFVSSSRSRLSACIMAVESLLYPLSWIHSFWPILSESTLTVLESPLPFIAGIHNCLLQSALEHVTEGTRVVNIDRGELFVVTSSVDRKRYLDLPELVAFYLNREMHKAEQEISPSLRNKIKENFSSYNYQNLASSNGISIISDEDAILVVNLITKPFLNLHVNLFGSYAYFVRKHSREVDLQAMIAVQNSPHIKSFLCTLFDSQIVRFFLDQKCKEFPNLEDDLFEKQARNSCMIVQKSTPLHLNANATTEEYLNQSRSWPLGFKKSHSHDCVFVHDYGDRDWRRVKDKRMRFNIPRIIKRIHSSNFKNSTRNKEIASRLTDLSKTCTPDSTRKLHTTEFMDKFPEKLLKSHQSQSFTYQGTPIKMFNTLKVPSLDLKIKPKQELTVSSKNNHSRISFLSADELKELREIDAIHKTYSYSGSK